MFYFVWSIRNAFPLPMCHIPYDVISTGMCSFILCVICFTLSFGLRSFIRYGISFLLSGPPGICFFYPVWTMFYFGFFDSECFLPSDLSYALYCHLHLWCVLSCYGSWALLYLVQSDRVPHPVCHMFYIVMSPLCFILSHVFYVLLCIVYSDCYLHPMCHYVLSCQFHPGYVILFHLIYFQIVLSSSDLLSWFNEMGKQYNHNLHKIRCCDTPPPLPPPNPRNIRQFQLETMTRWTHCFNLLLSVSIC